MNPNDPSMEKASMKGSDDDQITTENMSYAIETQRRVANPEEDGDLKRRLTASQVTMIALGGSIGTGLIIGTGSALRQGGPASLFISYVLLGACCFVVLSALGELSAHIPHKQGFAGHATRFVDPAVGTAIGYNYLFKYLIVTPNQLNATAILISYWRPDLSPAIWVSLMLVTIVILNNLGVKVFGHIEFWMSFMKIVILIGLLLFSLIIDLGGGPTGDRIGFRHWTNGQAFKEYKEDGPLGRFIGFWSCMTLALFAYMGSELVAVCVGESANPRKAMPQAVKSTFYRIIVFYLGGSLLVGMTVSATDPLLVAAAGGKSTAAASPFVIAATNAGVKVLPSLINACLLLFTVSAANSDLYVGSRTLYALADEGKAPRIFLKCNRMGVPYYSLALCTAFCGLAYLGVSAGGSQTFGYLTATISIFGAIAWFGILLSHIRFMNGMKAQGLSRDNLPYKSPLQPYASYIAISFVVLILFTKGFVSMLSPFDYKSFITHYVGIPVVFFIYLGWKIAFKTKLVGLLEMDLVNEAATYDYLDEKSEDVESVHGFKGRAKAIYENWKP